LFLVAKRFEGVSPQARVRGFKCHAVVVLHLDM
jgi:hypothetical protein